MPSDDDTIPNRSRRAQRARRRWSWLRGILIGLAAALLLGGAGYAVTTSLRDDDSVAASRADTGAASSPPASTAAAPATPAETDAAAGQSCRTPLNPVDPLRLWIGGDSLAGSLGPALGELTGGSGVVQPVVDAREGSGLLSPEFVDWPKRGREDMFTYNPEVTVFIVGANDAKTLQEGAERDPDWRERYSTLVEEMLTVLAGNSRTVYWVGAPVMADPEYSARVRNVNEVAQAVVAKHPEVTYVDAYSVFSAPDGNYAPSLAVPGRNVTRVRGADGIHFTPAGGDLLARAVFHRLDPECQVTQQAVQGVVKPTIAAKGSSPVPGTRRSGSTATTRASRAG
jgi:uncharacterized protein